MTKVLAIDFGLKRTGLAISDDARMFAFGIDTVDSSVLMDKLKSIVKDENVDTIVIGLPMSLNMTDTHITQNVHLLKEAIEKEIQLINVELIDERLTSKMASQSMHAAGATKKQKRNKGLVDKVSATLILQSYLSIHQ